MFVETIRQPGQSKIESNKALIERTERKRERERRPSIGENIKHFELLQNIYKLLISNCPSKRKVPSTTGGLNAEPPYGFAPNRTKMKRNSEFRMLIGLFAGEVAMPMPQVTVPNCPLGLEYLTQVGLAVLKTALRERLFPKSFSRLTGSSFRSINFW